MTGMLASVNCIEEAKLVLAENVDIIDLKEPRFGSLGALDTSLAKRIVTEINGQCPVSATIGDLPMQPELIFNAVKNMAQTGVDYIKVGFFSGSNQDQVIAKLAEVTADVNLVAVLFVDSQIDFKIVDRLMAAGFKGIMLDTQDKAKGSLTGMMSTSKIGRFVCQVRSSQLICGLAGSLTPEDIPLLLPYQPHYLGFRGALCDHNQRAGRLNPGHVRRIKQSITRSSS